MATKTKTTTKLQANPFQNEILELVSKQRSNAKKVEVLKEYRNDALVSLLIWNFDESVYSALPEGSVPYADNDEQTSIGGNLTDLVDSKVKSRNLKNGDYAGTDEVMNKQHTSLRNEANRFYIFIKGGSTMLSQVRKETIFIEMLKGLLPEEAELMCLVKDKKLSDKYRITHQNVKDAYPDITWGNRS